MSLSCDQIEEIEMQNSDDSAPDAKLNSVDSRPPNHEAVMKWYREEEAPKGAGIDTEDRPTKWFHGES